jgi:hypothetical protein
VLLVGEIEYVQPPPACWVSVNVWPAIANVPVRWLPVLFANTLYVTVPLPLPLDPELIPIQSQLPAFVEAVHAHPAPAVTATLPVPPPAPIVLLVGEIEAQEPVNV